MAWRFYSILIPKCLTFLFKGGTQHAKTQNGINNNKTKKPKSTNIFIHWLHYVLLPPEVLFGFKSEQPCLLTLYQWKAEGKKKKVGSWCHRHRLLYICQTQNGSTHTHVFKTFKHWLTNWTDNSSACFAGVTGPGGGVFFFVSFCCFLFFSFCCSLFLIPFQLFHAHDVSLLGVPFKDKGL